MKTQFKFETQIVNENAVFNTKPEHVLMVELQQSMKRLKLRSFKSYLKLVDTDRIQRTSISIKEIASLLNVSTYTATELAVEWMNNIGGRVVDHADINAYYFKDIYEITN